MGFRIWIGLIMVSGLGIFGGLVFPEPGAEFKEMGHSELFSRVLSEFQDLHRTSDSFSISKLPSFLVDRTLVDPEFALPHYYIYPFEAISAFAEAESDCKKFDEKIFQTLPKKLSLWLRHLCDPSFVLPQDFLSSFPYMHPGGHSFAQLVLKSISAARGNEKFFHVLEDENPRENNTISGDQIMAIMKGKRILLDQRKVWLRQDLRDDADPLAAVHFRYPRQAFEKYLHQVGLEIRRATNFEPEIFPHFQLEFSQNPMRSNSVRQYLLTVSLICLFSLLIAGVISLLVLSFRAQEKRKFSFQLLAHELRTPVSAMKIEMEELLKGYDELPRGAQALAVNIGNNLERLVQVVKVSDAYIRNKSGVSFLNADDSAIPSINEMFEKISEDFGHDVKFQNPPQDFAVKVDSYWLTFCVSNLITNGLRHGKAPVDICWEQSGEDLKVTVADAGISLLIDPRGHHSYTPSSAKEKGLGVGLQMVDRVARELGAKLEFSSAPTTWSLVFKKVVA